MTDIAAEQASATALERPTFYAFDGETWTPNRPARSPWSPRATSGVAIAGLLMHAVEQQPTAVPMLPVHATIDILRPVPYAPCVVRAEITRDGRKMQLVEAQILAEGEAVARARVLRVREADSPTIDAPLRYPPPEAFEAAPRFQIGYHLSTVVETRVASPPATGPTRGAMWARFGELAPGVPIDGVVQTAMLADLASPLSQVTDPAQFSFANMDLSLHLVRRPVGEWLLLEAASLMQGQGVAVTDIVLADVHGEFARAHQSLFIDAVEA